MESRSAQSRLKCHANHDESPANEVKYVWYVVYLHSAPLNMRKRVRKNTHPEPIKKEHLLK